MNIMDLAVVCLTLGCDFFERIGEKRIDIRRFLGYVCQIAKVRVRMSFGWVSLFLFLCAYAHIDIKNDYKIYTFFGFLSIRVHIDSQFFKSICVHIDIKQINVYRIGSHFLCLSFSLGRGKHHFRLYRLFSYLFTAEPADRPHTNLVEHALSFPQVRWLPLRSDF